jgi:cytochrome o ubiquinol oxidase operon protein cyoD
MNGKTTLTQPAPGHAARRSLIQYFAGFAFCILLTLLAYALVVKFALPGTYTILVIAGLAIIQLLVHLLFFLRVGRKLKPHWNLLVFGFALIVVIWVVGSLWVMNGKTQAETDNYIVNNESIE